PFAGRFVDIGRNDVEGDACGREQLRPARGGGGEDDHGLDYVAPADVSGPPRTSSHLVGPLRTSLIFLWTCHTACARLLWHLDRSGGWPNPSWTCCKARWTSWSSRPSRSWGPCTGTGSPGASSR